jgi:hypothetical protein
MTIASGKLIALRANGRKIAAVYQFGDILDAVGRGAS